MDLLYQLDDPVHSSSAEGLNRFVTKCFFIPQRYFLTLMGFFGLVTAYSMRLSLSVAITQMVPPPIMLANLSSSSDQPICPYNDENYNEEHYDYQAILDSLYSPDNDVYEWSQEQQGIILSSFYWGFTITQVPGALLSQRYGGKYVMMLGILFSAICTILTPIVVQETQATGLIVLRILSGLGEGVMYAALTDLLAAWVPLNERTTLGSFAYGGSTVGTIGGTYLAAFFIHKYNNWHQVFYFFGLLAIGWCLAFSALCYNRPECHPFIKDEEKQYLREQLGQPSTASDGRIQRPKIPWRQILTSVPFITLVFCQISHEWAFCIIVLDLPKYMHEVLHFSIEDNGLYSSLPQVFKLLMALVTGALSDWLIAKDYLTITSGRKIFVALASIFTGIFIVAASYAECDKMWVVVHFAISVAFQGVPGVAVNSLDLSPNYAGVLMGIGNTVSSITGILVPYIVGVATPNALLTEWRGIFWITFILQVIKMVIFSIWGRGDVQPWDTQSDCETDKLLNDDVSDCEMASTNDRERAQS